MNIVANVKTGMEKGNNPWDTPENCAKMMRARDNGGLVINVYAPKHIGDHDGKHSALSDYWQRMRAIAYLQLLMTKKLVGAPINSLTVFYVRDDPANEDVSRAKRKKQKTTQISTPSCFEAEEIAKTTRE